MHERAGGHQRHLVQARLQVRSHAPEPAVDVVVAHASVNEPREEVVLAPHDTLGHPGGAAGVEHVEVVAAAAPRREHAPDGGLDRILVGGGPVGTRSRAVVDPQPSLDAGHPIEDSFDVVGECAVEDDRHRVGVLPQVAQLVVAVAVVGVDGDQANLHGGEGGLDVLGRVVQVDRHLVLLGDPQVEQELRDAVGPTIELVPRDVADPLGHSDGVGLDLGHRLPDVCVVPVSHPRSVSAAISTTDPPTPTRRRHPRRSPRPPPRCVKRGDEPTLPAWTSASQATTIPAAAGSGTGWTSTLTRTVGNSRKPATWRPTGPRPTGLTPIR